MCWFCERVYHKKGWSIAVNKLLIARCDDCDQASLSLDIIESAVATVVAWSGWLWWSQCIRINSLSRKLHDDQNGLGRGFVRWDYWLLLTVVLFIVLFTFVRKITTGVSTLSCSVIFLWRFILCSFKTPHSMSFVISPAFPGSSFLFLFNGQRE
jgi:hypothetical protein